MKLKLTKEQVERGLSGQFRYGNYNRIHHISWITADPGCIVPCNSTKYSVYLHNIYDESTISYQEVKKRERGLDYTYVYKIEAQLSSLTPAELDAIIYAPDRCFRFLATSQNRVLFTYPWEEISKVYFSTLKECVDSYMKKCAMAIEKKKKENHIDPVKLGVGR